ncbi:hypothetical protein BB987_19845 [Photorhabdus temperata]|nr:hypothetical protein BB987_19845 [Photorhabdus temperata]
MRFSGLILLSERPSDSFSFIAVQIRHNHFLTLPFQALCEPYPTRRVFIGLIITIPVKMDTNATVFIKKGIDKAKTDANEFSSPWTQGTVFEVNRIITSFIAHLR